MPDINRRNIQHLRTRRNLTLEALAEKSRVSRATLSRIASGRTTTIRSVTADRLADALETDLETLTGADIVEDASERIFGRKTQMSIRIADDARNALTLVARRYSLKPAHIIHLAPFLFLWAAEASLKRRRAALGEIERQLGALSALPGPKHLNEIVTHHWSADDIVFAEQRSIDALDLFGTRIPDEHLSECYEENEENPFVSFLKSLADELGDLAEFDYWSTSWDQPGYQLGEAEALAMTGGDQQAASQITDGYAPLHELPKSVLDAGEKAVAAWAIERGDQYRREHFPDFDFSFEVPDRENDDA